MSMTKDQEITLLAMSDGLAADAEYRATTGKQQIEESKDKMDPIIEALIGEVEQGLTEAAETTPHYIRGVIIPDWLMNRIARVLSELEKENKWHVRWRTMTEVDVAAGGKMVGTIMNSMLQRIAETKGDAASKSETP